MLQSDMDMLKTSQMKRGQSTEIIDDLNKLENLYYTLKYKLDTLNREANEKIKLREKVDNKQEIKNLEQLVKKTLEDKNRLYHKIGNIVHPSVPLINETILRTWGEIPIIENMKHHHELLYMIGGYESEMGAEIAGHRGYYLTGIGMLLNNAIVQYGLKFLALRKYIPVQTPYLMKQKIMEKVASLAEFDESLYKVIGNQEDESMYLIATSEQPLAALNMNKKFNKKQLPIKYCGYSTNFRKEAGKHGQEAWGIFRVHQFEKIEQFVICEPEKSWEMMEEMIGVSEEFYQSLNLPYQIIDIISSDLNQAAARKYDLEAWFPTLGKYRELVSCSNCTDYQAKRLNIKLEKNYVHMLNSTLTATERTLCCLLENNQTAQGIRVPEVLKPYLEAFLEDPNMIPYVQGPPKLGKGAKGKY